jgi:hypothetical protein
MVALMSKLVYIYYKQIHIKIIAVGRAAHIKILDDCKINQMKYYA